eukprot:2740240-Prymnesium_polylepis.1
MDLSTSSSSTCHIWSAGARVGAGFALGSFLSVSASLLVSGCTRAHVPVSFFWLFSLCGARGEGAWGEL